MTYKMSQPDTLGTFSTGDVWKSHSREHRHIQMDTVGVHIQCSTHVHIHMYVCVHTGAW